jgi:hypothetical protein
MRRRMGFVGGAFEQSSSKTRPLEEALKGSMRRRSLRRRAAAKGARPRADPYAAIAITAWLDWDGKGGPTPAVRALTRIANGCGARGMNTELEMLDCLQFSFASSLFHGRDTGDTG